MELASSVGQFPVPITHGMTMGEFAQMINGEGWIANKLKCKIKIIPVKNYVHSMPYRLPVYPSPNLNTQQSILLYPSLCLFEGTIISQGRGTYMPFTVLGNPDLKDKYNFSFTPRSIPGKSEKPMHMNTVCYGLDLRNYNTAKLHGTGMINLKWLIEMYEAYPYKDKFFTSRPNNKIDNFEKLAGTRELRKQIIAGASEEEIRKTWEPGLKAYKKMRANYVIYPD